jgi:hypothetical protein
VGRGLDIRYSELFCRFGIEGAEAVIHRCAGKDHSARLSPEFTSIA